MDDILENSDSVAAMVEKSTEKLKASEENLNKNIAVLKTTRELEQAYRSVTFIL
jgi:prefoldin subunit 5